MQLESIAPGGIRTYVGFDNDDDSMIVRRMQNVTPYLERNHYLREHANLWRGEDDTFWHVASIPNVIMEQWLREGIDIWTDRDWPKIQRKLNGEFKYLKTAPVMV